MAEPVPHPLVAPPTNTDPPATPGVAWLLVAGGLIGLAASLILTIEKLALAADPNYIPRCSINPVLSCGSVMNSPQAELFGFPNPLIGIVGFTIVLVTGTILAGNVQLPRWYWLGLQTGVTLGLIFVHWLAFQSIYRIGALCPYCMIVWAATIPLFFYITLRNARACNPHSPSHFHRAASFAARFHTTLLTAWYLTFAVAIAVQFWDAWLLMS